MIIIILCDHSFGREGKRAHSFTDGRKNTAEKKSRRKMKKRVLNGRKFFSLSREKKEKKVGKEKNKRKKLERERKEEGARKIRGKRDREKKVRKEKNQRKEREKKSSHKITNSRGSHLFIF